MKKLTFVLVFLLCSCATTHYVYEKKASDFPISELTLGRSLNEVRKTIEKEPYNGFFIKETTILAPLDEKQQMLVIDYYFNKRYWILFLDAKLIGYGTGVAEKSEFYIYQTYCSHLLREQKIKRSDAEKLLYNKFKDLHGSDPFVDEFFTYRIMIAEKLDAGEIKQTEADYLFAQKASEIEVKLKTIRYQEAQLQIQQQQLYEQRQQTKLARSQVFLQFLQTYQAQYKQYQQHKTYNIMPFGSGWLMQEW